MSAGRQIIRLNAAREVADQRAIDRFGYSYYGVQARFVPHDGKRKWVLKVYHDEHEDRVMVRFIVRVNDDKIQLEFTEPFETFPSDAMVAQVLLVT
ncbi:MAG TPA: hypothetical protein VKT73_15385 [Xanthobacteraceae bacterium]|nr:hypothetical protein [Xanthobacteraceae bacterium]